MPNRQDSVPHRAYMPCLYVDHFLNLLLCFARSLLQSINLVMQSCGLSGIWSMQH